MTLVKAPDDLSLAARCAAGDRAAQRRLFEEQRSRVHAILYRIVGNNHDIDDLIQDSFLEIFRSLGHFRGEAKLGTWIDRITTRVAYAYFGRRRPASVHLEAVAELPSHDPSAERRAFAREAARRLYDALDRVEVKQRIAFALHVIDGKPLREVATIMEASLVATKSRVWRARREVERRARRDPVLRTFIAGADEEQGEHHA